MATFGELIRAHRERVHLTQVDVEERARISQSHLSALEVGRRGPSVPVLRRLGGTYALTDAELGELLRAPLRPEAVTV